MIEPMNTPWRQSKASVIRGTTEDLRPPKSIAEIGTPEGSYHSGAIAGSCDAGVQELPFQSVTCAGGSLVMPSHHTSPSSVNAVLVKMQLADSVSMALRL